MIGQSSTRTTVVAALSLAMGLLAHVLQGGSTPSSGDLLAVVVLAVVLAAVLARRSLTVGSLALRLIAIQVVIHLMCQVMPAAHDTHQVSHPATNSPVVLAVHVAAVVLVAMWLVAVEGHLRRLVEVLWRVWAVVGSRSVVATEGARLSNTEYLFGPFNFSLLDADLVRRGPPLAV